MPDSFERLEGLKDFKIREVRNVVSGRDRLSCGVSDSRRLPARAGAARGQREPKRRSSQRETRERLKPCPLRGPFLRTYLARAALLACIGLTLAACAAAPTPYGYYGPSDYYAYGVRHVRLRLWRRLAPRLAS
jgi:hypothetical protein